MSKIELDLTDEMFDEIETLRESGHLSSSKEVLANALALLNWAYRESQSGRSIMAVDERNGQIRELSMPILDTFKRGSDPIYQVEILEPDGEPEDTTAERGLSDGGTERKFSDQLSIKKILQEIDLVREQITSDQSEIDRLRAETKTKLKELEAA